MIEGDYSTSIAIVGFTVTTVIGFLFGKSGIFNRILDVRMRNIEKAQTNEEKAMSQMKQENTYLHKQVEDLTKKVKELEMDLADTKQRLDIMLAYFEKINPAPDEFVEKVIRRKVKSTK